MPQFNSDVTPDVTGRKLGGTTKRYDAYFRDVDISGALIGGLGNETLVPHNPTPGIDTVDIQSDTGTGGMLRRVRIKNDAGSAKVNAEFQNLDIRMGSEQATLGGIAPLNLLSALAEDGQAVLRILRAGETRDGIQALLVTNRGELGFYNNDIGASLLSAYAPGDAQARFQLRPGGSMVWGPGAATVPDLGLARIGINRAALTNGAAGFSTLDVNSINFQQPDGIAPFTVISSTKVTGLNADLLDGADFASPNPIGAVTPTTGAFTTLSASGQITSTVATGTIPLVIGSTTPVPNLTVQRIDSPNFLTIIPPNSAALKHKRIAIASLAAGARATITWIFTTAFSSANYSVTTGLFDSGNTGGPGLRIERQVGQSATQCQVQIINDDTAAHTGTLHLHAMLEIA